MADTPDVKPPAKILIVNDEVVFLHGMREILELEDYIVITASNGVEGLQALAAQPDVPDLIISNVVMPEMDGFTFVRELQKKPEYRHIPIIMESALADYKTKALEVGAAFFLTMPFTAEELLAAVADLLARK